MAGGRRRAAGLRRREVLRWLLLLEFSDLLLEGFHGYLALYLVDVAGSSAIYRRNGGCRLVRRSANRRPRYGPVAGARSGQTYLWSSAAAVLATFPMFLLVPVLGLKLVVIAMLGFASAGWYPVLQGRVYSSMPGQSGSVMAVKSASGLVGSFVPLALGVLAQHWGLQAMMWLMLASPAALLAGTRIPPTAKRSRPDS